MVLQLPEPVRDKLARSPLQLVVCQVRHEHNSAIGDSERALSVHNTLRDDYPKFDDHIAQDVRVLAGPAGVQPMTGETLHGFRFRSRDDSWTVVVMPDFFALETTKYDDWADYNKRLRAVTTAVETSLAPVIERRLGIRYVTRLTDPLVRTPRDWGGKINDSLLGAIAHPGLSEGLLNSQAVVLLQASEDIQVLLRHGCFPEQDGSGSYSYLLDHDCFREGGRRFSVEDTMRGAEQIHTVALQLFQTALTPEYFRQLWKGDELA
jgi:uncharacterized protein (TIGR04255 family)